MDPGNPPASANHHPTMNTQITRWNPFKELDELQNRFASVWGLDPLRLSSQEQAVTVAQWIPRVDICEDDKEFVIKTELPEMKKEDVKVSVEDGALTISGERKLEKDEKGKTYHRIEREYGTFFRSFTLPAEASGKNVAAEFKDGVLKVHLPKDVKAAASKAIEIKVA
jgi:HSP20 family protein